MSLPSQLARSIVVSADARRDEQAPRALPQNHPHGVEMIVDVRPALERRLLDALLERVRQQPFADEAEREECLRSVQTRLGSGKRRGSFGAIEPPSSPLPARSAGNSAPAGKSARRRERPPAPARVGAAPRRALAGAPEAAAARTAAAGREASRAVL